jgi:hypothetical protein
MVSSLASIRPFVSDFELRILRYLDQHGPVHRQSWVPDLVSPHSKTARCSMNGSNGAIPLIAGKWCRQLVHLGLVTVERDREGYYRAHSVTSAGRHFLRIGA